MTGIADHANIFVVIALASVGAFFIAVRWRPLTAVRWFERRDGLRSGSVFLYATAIFAALHAAAGLLPPNDLFITSLGTRVAISPMVYLAVLTYALAVSFAILVFLGVLGEGNFPLAIVCFLFLGMVFLGIARLVNAVLALILAGLYYLGAWVFDLPVTGPLFDILDSYCEAPFAGLGACLAIVINTLRSILLPLPHIFGILAGGVFAGGCLRRPNAKYIHCILLYLLIGFVIQFIHSCVIFARAL